MHTTLPNYVNVILFSEPSGPKAKRKVSFSHVVGLGTIEKTVPREESPCYDDKKLQIFSFVSLFILVFIAIIILAVSRQAKGMLYDFENHSLIKIYSFT